MLDSDGALVLGLGDESLSASFDVEDSATLESLIACYDRATKFGRDAELAEIGRGLYRWLNGKFREVEALAGPALAAELAAVVDGRLLTPQPDALGPCVELEWTPGVASLAVLISGRAEPDRRGCRRRRTLDPRATRPRMRAPRS
jgi:hypothetical protein